jgi:hypothetical protein
MPLLALSRPRVLVLTALVAGATLAGAPYYRAYRKDAERRACAATCKTIAGAIEMYDLDH